MGDLIGISDHRCKAESRAEDVAVTEMAKRIAGQCRFGDDPRLFVYALVKVALLWKDSDHYAVGRIEFVQDVLQEEIATIAMEKGND